MYGTLHPDRAPAEIADVARSFEQLGAGTVRGAVHDLGDYPGLVLGGHQSAAGEVFRVPDDAGLWARLDAYEGFNPDDPAGSLFVRVETLVTMSGSAVVCWVYVWNRG